MFNNFRNARRTSARLIIWSLFACLALSAAVGVVESWIWPEQKGQASPAPVSS